MIVFVDHESDAPAQASIVPPVSISTGRLMEQKRPTMRVKARPAPAPACHRFNDVRRRRRRRVLNIYDPYQWCLDHPVQQHTIVNLVDPGSS